MLRCASSTSWPKLLAEIDLRFAVVRMRLVLDDVEMQMVERAAHLVEAILRLHQNLVEPVLDRPGFLLLGQRAEMALTRASRGGCRRSRCTGSSGRRNRRSRAAARRDRTVWESCSAAPDFVCHLVGHRHHGARDRPAAARLSSGSGGRGSPAARRSPRPSSAAVFAKELFDVLNLQRSLLEGILHDPMFQCCSLSVTGDQEKSFDYPAISWSPDLL